MSRRPLRQRPAPFGAAPSAPRDAARYLRARDLPGLIPLWPGELAVSNIEDHRRLLHLLRSRLRAERRRGLANDWTYDLARHANLLRAYRAELALYAAARLAGPQSHQPPSAPEKE